MEIPVAKPDRRCFSGQKHGVPCFVKRYSESAQNSYVSEKMALAKFSGSGFTPDLLSFDDATRTLYTTWVNGKQASELVNVLDDCLICSEMGHIYAMLTEAPSQYEIWYEELLDNAVKALKPICWDEKMEELLLQAQAVSSLSMAQSHTDFHFENVIIMDTGHFVAIDFEEYGLDAPAITAVKVSMNPLFIRRRENNHRMRLKSFMNACAKTGLVIDEAELFIAGAFWALTYSAYHIKRVDQNSNTLHKALFPCHELVSLMKKGVHLV